MTGLGIEIAGVKLKNPTVLAAGVLGTTGESLKKVAESGAGAVTTKSLSLEPKKGHNNPTVVDRGDVLLNAMGLPNPGVGAFLDEIKTAKKGKAAVIASIFGKTAEEFAQAAEKVSDAKPDLIELNISCPNVGALGTAFGCDPDAAGEVTKQVKAITDIPISVKLTPNTHLLTKVAAEVESAGADAITAINSVGPGMAIDIETGVPVLENYVGGVSGKLIRPIAVRCVYDIYKTVSIPIIGVGGVYTGGDAAELMMAGASAVGIGTAVKDRGVDVFASVCKELDEFLERRKYKSAKELVGLAHKEVHK